MLLLRLEEADKCGIFSVYIFIAFSYWDLTNLGMFLNCEFWAGACLDAKLINSLQY